MPTNQQFQALWEEIDKQNSRSRLLHLLNKLGIGKKRPSGRPRYR